MFKKKIFNAINKIDNVLVPKIYQVKFENNPSIKLEDYPDLYELGEWLSYSTKSWGCHSKLNKVEFENEFFTITNLTENEVKITYGGEGMNPFFPGWRQSVNEKKTKFIFNISIISVA